MPTNKPKKLPKKPSALILAALEDLKAVEKTPFYKVNMNIYHLPDTEVGVCEVCLAGAVMAQSLKVSPIKMVDPDDFDTDTMGKLFALDDFRRGSVFEGLDVMGLRTDKVEELFPEELYITPYEDGPAAFKRDMRKLARKLQKAGL